MKERVVAFFLVPWLTSVYRRATAVIGIAPTMAERLVDRGVSRDKGHQVFNWAKEDALPRARTRDAEKVAPNETRVLYAWNVADMQDIETSVVATQRAREAGILVTILGDGIALPRMQALVERIGATNVAVVPTVARSEMEVVYAATDFALVTLKDLEVFEGAVPSKCQAAMTHTTLIITTACGDVTDIVEQPQIRFGAAPESIEELVRAFQKAAELSDGARQELATRAGAAYRDNFSRDAGVEGIEAIDWQAAVR